MAKTKTPKKRRPIKAVKRITQLKEGDRIAFRYPEDAYRTQISAHKKGDEVRVVDRNNKVADHDYMFFNGLEGSGLIQYIDGTSIELILDRCIDFRYGYVNDLSVDFTSCDISLITPAPRRFCVTVHDVEFSYLENSKHLAISGNGTVRPARVKKLVGEIDRMLTWKPKKETKSRALKPRYISINQIKVNDIVTLDFVELDALTKRGKAWLARNQVPWIFDSDVSCENLLVTGVWDTHISVEENRVPGRDPVVSYVHKDLIEGVFRSGRKAKRQSRPAPTKSVSLGKGSYYTPTFFYADKMVQAGCQTFRADELPQIRKFLAKFLAHAERLDAEQSDA